MRILLTGATGLVGQGVLHECLHAPDVQQVIVLGRRPCGRQAPQLDEVLVPDFRTLGPVEDSLQPIDACLYCAGAPPIGTPEARYREVTVDLTTHVARVLARLNPGLRFIYISGAGADPASHFMPLRVKGEAEQALAALPMQAVMVRPGGIQPVHGEVSPHPALATLYRVGGPLMGLAARLAPAAMTTTERLGRAMLALARESVPPPVVDNALINRLGM